MGGILGSTSALTAYMLLICVGSLFTTSEGFKLYLYGAPSYVIWGISGAFQILIYVSSIGIANSSVSLIRRIMYLVVFIFCMIISSLASFLYFDKMLTVG